MLQHNKPMSVPAPKKTPTMKTARTAPVNEASLRGKLWFAPKPEPTVAAGDSAAVMTGTSENK